MLRTVAAAVGDADPEAVLDAGAGPGRYLAAALSATPAAVGVAVDVSVAAVRRAARSHPRIGAVAADVWRDLPVADRAVDVVLSVFAPRHPAEFARVLAPGGRLVTVTPRPDHLAELRDPLGLLDVPADKPNRIAEQLRPWFVRKDAEPVVATATWGADALLDLVGMGPNAFHRNPATTADQLQRLDLPLAVTVAVDVTTWSV